MITFRKLGKLGRFGNQLFQYAGTRLYAELNGFSHALPNWIGTTLFSGVKSYTFTEFLKSKLLPTRQLSDMRSYNRLQKMLYLLGASRKLPNTISMEYLYEHPEDNINLYGYLQDVKSISLLLKHRSRIQRWLEFRPEIQKVLKATTDHLKPWTGVHIRRGDLVKRSLSVPITSFKDTLDSIRSPNSIFIASDDPNIHTEFKEYKLIKPEVRAAIPPEIFDFWMLSQAETIIGPGSTFSWWAAYLGNPKAYYAPPLTHLWKPNTIPAIERQAI